MDADLSHEPAVLRQMAESIVDADLVLASRYVAGGGVDAQWGWHRKLMSWPANRVVVPALLSLPVTDATSGFRLWRRDALARIARAVNARSTGYGFQVEMAYLAHRTGCRITRGADLLPRARIGPVEDESRRRARHCARNLYRSSTPPARAVAPTLPEGGRRRAALLPGPRGGASGSSGSRCRAPSPQTRARPAVADRGVTQSGLQVQADRLELGELAIARIEDVRRAEIEGAAVG